MVERICPACQHGNPLENRYCGACGAALEHTTALATRPAEAAIVVAGQRITLAQAKQVGKAVAVGLAAVAAEAGLAWIRRRAEQAGAPTTALAARPSPQTPAQTAGPAADVVTIVSQRVVEIWDHGNLTRQIVEKHVWKKEG